VRLQLAFRLCLVLALPGCQFFPQPPPTMVVHEVGQPCETPRQSSLSGWLEELERVMQLAPEQARAELAALDGPGEALFERYRFALLLERLGERDAWIRARDIFRDFREDSDLEPGLKRLSAALQQHSQAMINAETRERQLDEELQAARDQQRELAAKIEALTSLEQSISQRKSQEEAPPLPTPAPDPGDRQDGS
jgi:hypothetical protein